MIFDESVVYQFGLQNYTASFMSLIMGNKSTNLFPFGVKILPQYGHRDRKMAYNALRFPPIIRQDKLVVRSSALAKKQTTQYR